MLDYTLTHFGVGLAHVLVELAVALRVLLERARVGAGRRARPARRQLERHRALRAPAAHRARVRLRLVVEHHRQRQHRRPLLESWDMYVNHINRL